MDDLTYQEIIAETHRWWCFRWRCFWYPGAGGSIREPDLALSIHHDRAHGLLAAMSGVWADEGATIMSSRQIGSDRIGGLSAKQRHS